MRIYIRFPNEKSNYLKCLLTPPKRVLYCEGGVFFIFYLCSLILIYNERGKGEGEF